MKFKSILLLVIILMLSSCQLSEKTVESKPEWIRVNQLGYLPESTKTAVFCQKDMNVAPDSFLVVDSRTGESVQSSTKIDSCGPYGPFTGTFRLDLSSLSTPGSYYIKINKTVSPEFDIAADVYDGTADFLLRYMRQQRCGYNPFLDDSCHVHDGFAVYDEENNGQFVDVFGGWHDAADYLQYLNTSSNAVFQMLISYRDFPNSFRDAYMDNGLPGANGIPDVIDEAKWGMDWLCRMNPSPDRFYNQIADDRDHAGFRMPYADTVAYREDGPGRPVYLCTGEIQGLKKYKNRASGTASSAGKYASAFAVGYEVLQDFYPNYSESLLIRSRIAYGFGKQKPGACQTAPCTAPYFYEEDNWADDMELAAAELYKLTHKKYYKNEMIDFSLQEPVTPWMGADTARHYQWYPFFNAGHHEAALTLEGSDKDMMTEKYYRGLKNIYDKGKENAFYMGVPFIWCSNNLVTAAMTQCLMYRRLTSDTQFEKMEAGLRDWLFGCNPWGTSMIVGLPVHGDSPQDPHSSLSVMNPYYTIDGGLVDGPVYTSIFGKLKGLRLLDEDEYAQFQSDLVVYHDDIGDYSTNEPTMDGTACLVYYLAAMENTGENQSGITAAKDYEIDRSGAIRRGSRDKKEIALIFTAHDLADGAEVITDTLKAHKIKSSFFFTGGFYRTEAFKPAINKLLADGHYLGAHSNRHLLYNDWTKDKKRLVSKDEFVNDLRANYAEMAKFGISKKDAPYFIPPYEWNDERITLWAYQEGITLFNYSSGTLSHTDYTTEKNGKSYHANDEIYNSIDVYEKQNGMEGFILLIHFGADRDRPEKFYNELGRLLTDLEGRGYDFVRIDELLNLNYARK